MPGHRQQHGTGIHVVCVCVLVCVLLPLCCSQCCNWFWSRHAMLSGCIDLYTCTYVHLYIHMFHTSSILTSFLFFQITLAIAQQFSPRRIVGVDIDHRLVRIANKNLFRSVAEHVFRLSTENLNTSSSTTPVYNYISEHSSLPSGTRFLR